MSAESAGLDEDLGGELARLISDASSALTQLDAEALEELGRRAEALAAFNLGGSGVSRRALVPVLEGRLRVFAALLEATSENLASLRRAEAQETFGADSFGLGVGLGGSRKSGYSGGFSGSAYSGGSRGFFESLGLYDDLNPGESSWSRTAKGRNSA